MLCILAKYGLSAGLSTSFEVQELRAHHGEVHDAPEGCPVPSCPVPPSDEGIHHRGCPLARSGWPLGKTPFSQELAGRRLSGFVAPLLGEMNGHIANLQHGER